MTVQIKIFTSKSKLFIKLKEAEMGQFFQRINFKDISYFPSIAYFYFWQTKVNLFVAATLKSLSWHAGKDNIVRNETLI